MSDDNKKVQGNFVTRDGERYYEIRNFDRMPPFFMSLVSDGDHWLFISSSGGLSAGRVSPETALFPYINVDQIHECSPHTGSKTLLRVSDGERTRTWEPFNREHDDRYAISRNLYKNVLGNKLLFEEINHDLNLAFSYRWMSSEEYGFVRQCRLANNGCVQCRIDLLDGLQNLLPAGTPRTAQTNTSYLVDAYKYSELDAETGLGMFTLFSAITDRAEPCESLRATTAFCLGLEGRKVLLSSRQIGDFRSGKDAAQEHSKRGLRGAYLVTSTLDLAPGSSHDWQIVANTEQTQARVVDLLRQLRSPAALGSALAQSVEKGSDALARILASGDGFQLSAEENVSAHHYANALFNILRGGIFARQYKVDAEDFARTVRLFNTTVYRRHRDLLASLPREIDYGDLQQKVRGQNDPQLTRLTCEYLPITFGRRHGDPSRPWNQFAIRLKDEHGKRLLSYEGNWRDIFQNWEALLLSYPEFIETVIAKFVNASTADGYNPYRITKEGIDWEVEEPDDPWSYIGYWGDHQIIYLQKLLELALQYHPARLHEFLHEAIFSYANVPYRIKPFEALLEDAKSTVTYDHEKAHKIEQRVSEIGADGKLLLDAEGRVYQVNMLEKLLVPLLSKLGNLVVDGGIWLNTQRPEWNDANNALVGQGLSMVTLYYMRRFVSFLQELLADETGSVVLSREVSAWLSDTAQPLRSLRDSLGQGPLSAGQRFRTLEALGKAASTYRETVYRQEGFSGTETQSLELITAMLGDALAAIDHSMQGNRREDDLFHAYNLLEPGERSVEVGHLYPMLEGQVAALSSGAVTPEQAVDVIEALFASDMYRRDQDSFLLYPDRDLPSFLDKNRVPGDKVESIGLLTQMLERGDARIIERDAEGCYRFNAAITNAGRLNARLDALRAEYPDLIDAARVPLQTLHEQVFDHQAFTGRSGGMFAFEGLGSIYWHMVSKLLLAVQENFFAACASGTDAATIRRLGELYYRIRGGIGFNKSPGEYGAFPTDPYSHTPAHVGAQQPGMTGQVKEEILARFGELGIRVDGGAVNFEPGLLREREFLEQAKTFRFLDVDEHWQELRIPQQGLAFSWCQVPLVYRLVDSARPSLTATTDDEQTMTSAELRLSPELASEVFRRSGRIRRIELVLNRDLLLAG